MAIVDPLSTLSMSPEVTGTSGLDVLTNAAESFTTKPYNMRPKPVTRRTGKHTSAPIRSPNCGARRQSSRWASV